MAKRLQIGGQNRGQICQKVDKKRFRIPIPFFLRCLIDFWGSGPWLRIGFSYIILRFAGSESYPKTLTKIQAKRIQNGTRIHKQRLQKAYRKLWLFFDRFCLDLASQSGSETCPIFDFLGSVSAPGTKLEATSLKKAARERFRQYFLRCLIVFSIVFGSIFLDFW